MSTTARAQTASTARTIATSVRVHPSVMNSTGGWMRRLGLPVTAAGENSRGPRRRAERTATARCRGSPFGTVRCSRSTGPPYRGDGSRRPRDFARSAPGQFFGGSPAVGCGPHLSPPSCLDARGGDVEAGPSMAVPAARASMGWNPMGVCLLRARRASSPSQGPPGGAQGDPPRRNAECACRPPHRHDGPSSLDAPTSWGEASSRDARCEATRLCLVRGYRFVTKLRCHATPGFVAIRRLPGRECEPATSTPARA